MELKKCICSYENEMIAWRRDFHSHPETGFEEIRTSKKIIEILSGLAGVEVIKDFCKTAVVAIIKGNNPGPVIGLRADMDALPLSDTKDVSYKSQNPGKCHACGHDVHVTVDLGVIKYYSLNMDKLNGTLKVIFQPAEEGPAPGGAKPLVETGITSDVDVMIGMHTNPDHEVGTILLRKNEMLASADNFEIHITGTGGHGAYPHQATDPLRTGIEIYNEFQTMLTREMDPVKPVLMSVCSFNGGTVKGTNVIPKSISMSGTLRTFDNSIRDYVINRVKEIVSTICRLNRCEGSVDIATVSIALNNDNELIDLIEKVGDDVLGSENVKYMNVPEMGYDDFAYYGLKSRAVYFYLGTTNKSNLGEFTFHQSNFDVDERCLRIGVEVLINIINKIRTKEE